MTPDQASPAKIASPVARRGITLSELLVVIIILTTVTAAVIPVVVPAIQSRQIREAARGVNIYIAGARYRAQEIGRPVGVLFERIPGQPRAVRTLRYVEIPTPYSGLTESATVQMIEEDPADPTHAFYYGTFNEPIPPGVIRLGDLLRVNYQGGYYRLVRVDATNVGLANAQEVDGYVVTSNISLPTSLRFEWIPDGSVPPAISGVATSLPYQIFRQPLPTSVTPYQLPEGTVIDLAGSGPGRGGAFPIEIAASNSQLMLTFNPDGTLHRFYSDWTGALVGQQVLDTLVFLVGKWEYVIDPSDPAVADEDRANANWRQPKSFWISVAAATGNVATVDNAQIPDAIGPGAPLQSQLMSARAYVFTNQPASGG